MKMRPARSAAALGLLLTLLAAAPSARAADLYLAGGLVNSFGSGKSSIESPFFDLSGSDRDSSPAWYGTLGFGFRLNELEPDGWGAKMPPLALRFELEGSAGRSYEFRTGSGSASYFSDFDAWTVGPNVWLDVPIEPIAAKAFGRIPVLRPLSLYAGGGFGLASFNFETTDNFTPGSSSGYNFSWRYGGGLSWAITKSVTVTAGYQRIDLGSVEADLELAPGISLGTQRADISAHEFSSSLRFDFHTQPLEDMIPERWAWPKIKLPSLW